MARLEERLGRALFERGKRRLELTDAGDVFYKVCVRVLDELNGAERMLSTDEITPSGRLRVDMPATFGRMHGMPAMIAFTEKYPQVSSAEQVRGSIWSMSLF
ncbi:LysR family transcriptional regulator [Herbaspirillum seropedicae]|nr:LysR family transcriptional regulator [Herbaspirillum seropedicae]